MAINPWALKSSDFNWPKGFDEPLKSPDLESERQMLMQDLMKSKENQIEERFQDFMDKMKGKKSYDPMKQMVDPQNVASIYSPWSFT
jgi:hypothetical protein